MEGLNTHRQQDDFNQGFRMAKIIYFSLLLALFVYFFVAYYFAQMSANEPSDLGGHLEKLKIIFLFFGIFLFLAIRPFKKFLLGRNFSALNSTPGISKNPKMAKLFSTHIILLAISETITIFGLIITFLSLNLMDFYPFFVLSIILFLRLNPRHEEWKKFVFEDPDNLSMEDRGPGAIG